MTKVAAPTEIRLRENRTTLTITFADGRVEDLSAELLRVCSPSAEVQGHSPAEKRTVPGKRHVAIKELNPIGTYALQIVFDDGHDSGYFTWEYLDEMARHCEPMMLGYINELAAKGLSRDPAKAPEKTS